MTNFFGLCLVLAGRGWSLYSPTSLAKSSRRLAVTSTSPEEMFSLAEGMVDTESADVVVGTVNYKRCRENPDAPKLLFVPGIEFRGLSMAAQVSSLARAGYEPWVAWVDGEDRSTFEDLSSSVKQFVAENDVEVLVGESFGGLVVADLVTSGDVDVRAVLVNPATSFQRSLWASSGAIKDLVTTEGPGYPAAIGAAITFLASDSSVFAKSVEELRRGDTSSGERAWTSAQTLSKLVPAPTLKFRIEEWLDVGSRRVDRKLFQLTKVKERFKAAKKGMLVLIGEKDNFLPSASEAGRLGRVFPNATISILKEGGHALLIDPERLDLGKAIRNTLYKKDPVKDFVPPTKEQLAETRRSLVNPLRRLVSPVFFSTSNGVVARGLGGVPLPANTGRPVLLVGNHQLFGLDLSILIDAFLRERDTLIRGLAHPAATGNAMAAAAAMRSTRRRSQVPDYWRATDSSSSSSSTGPGDTFFTRFGAVEVTPRNFFKLMQEKSAVLLFPGGVKESNHGKNEAHRLFWPESSDFVRVAAQFDADIVPFGAVGIADSFEILRDRDDPIFPGRNNATTNIPSARRWAGEEEDFRFPLAVPSPRGPARCYFYFGEAVSTENIDPKDRESCAALYKQIKRTSQRSIDVLLEARKSDPFERPARRLALESITTSLVPRGSRRRGEESPLEQAPTFPTETLPVLKP